MARRSIDIRKLAVGLRAGLAGHLELEEDAVTHVLAVYDHVLTVVLLDVLAGAPAAQVALTPRKTRKPRARKAAAPVTQTAAGEAARA